MSDKNPVKNINQNIDKLEPKPQSPNTIKQPDKSTKEEKTIEKRTSNYQKNKKLLISKIFDDDLDHPQCLLSDCCEENEETIIKDFYENKKKEKISLVEKTKNLSSYNAPIIDKKMKVHHDSIQLKENICKVVLNSKFMNDKNLKKNYSNIIKPEKVINNFILERSNDIKKMDNLKKYEIFINNKNMNFLTKNNCTVSFKNHNIEKVNKYINKNNSQAQMRKIVKFPLNLMGTEKQKIKQINKNSQLTKKDPEKVRVKNNNNNLQNKKHNSSVMNEMPKKKIVKILPMNQKAITETKKEKDQQIKINLNHITNIRNHKINQNKTVKQNQNNNTLNKIVIRNNYNSLNTSISRNSNKINSSFENQLNIVKMISPIKLENLKRSIEITLSNEQSNKIKKIPLPYNINKNNDSNNLKYPSIKKENSPTLFYPTETNIKIKNTQSINKFRDSCNESEKENLPFNLATDNCNKKTFERGGKFNNNSTTFVVISKKSPSKFHFPEPSLIMDNTNFIKNKMLNPNFSALSIQQSPMNCHNKLNSIYTQKNSSLRNVIKFNKNQKYSTNVTINNNLNSTNQNISLRNINYSGIYYAKNNKNYEKENSYIKTEYNYKNRILNKPTIYKYYNDGNFWPEESYFSYLNNSGYNY